ncbi:MAG TPA: hypothetical protein VK020_06945 [Microlunatus sp.]|nr:hypothetical protein [Microlunatus sp.]
MLIDGGATYWRPGTYWWSGRAHRARSHLTVPPGDRRRAWQLRRHHRG